MDDSGPRLACLFCTQYCYNTHGEGKPSGATVPTFCKIMSETVVEDSSSPSVLELPAAFVKQHRNELQKDMIIEGPSGQTWSVELCGSKYNMSFRRGWEAFSMDHNLCQRDILLFKLTTKAYFVVQIFDKDGCEKDLFGVQNSAALASEKLDSSSKRRRKRVSPQSDVMKTSKTAYAHLVESKESSPGSENGIEINEVSQCAPCADAALMGNRKQVPGCHITNQSSAGCKKDLLGATFASQNFDRSSKCSLKLVSPQRNVVGTGCKHKKPVKMAHASHLVERKESSPSTEHGIDMKGISQCTPCADVSLTGNRKEVLVCNVANQSSALDMAVLWADDHKYDDVSLIQGSNDSCKTPKLEVYHEDIGGSSMPPATVKRNISLDFCDEKAIMCGKHLRVSKIGPFYRGISFIQPVSDAMVAAKSHRVHHPYIIVKMKRSNVTHGFWLTVEKKFARQWLPMVNSVGFLENIARSRWIVKWLGKRGGLAAGWRKFSLENGLQEKDVCLFELTSQMPFVFMVHMFRESRSS